MTTPPPPPPLPAQLPITPITRPVSGSVTLPGSKSLTNRALLLAALCDAPVTLTGALFSEDTTLMITALRQLGLAIAADPAARTIRVSNQQNRFTQTPSPIPLDVGLAGTAARFLTALCAAAPRGIYRIDGVPQMRKRPMRGLLDALRSLGADIRHPGEPHHLPIEIHARGLRGGPVEIDATESSQMLSALLLISPLCAAPPDIRLSKPVREPFVQMTKKLMTQFGTDGASPCRSPGVCAIEPDATAASYYLALPLVTGGALTLASLRGPGSDSLQGDTRFATILTSLGLNIQNTATGLTASFSNPKLKTQNPNPEIQNPKSKSQIPNPKIQNPNPKIQIPNPKPQTPKSYNFSEFSDTFLTLAAIAPLLPHPVRITGIAHTRKQETDRVAGMARELTRLGQRVIETEDTLEIHPRPLHSGQTIETYHDHRFAMSFAILGCHDLHANGRPWLTIDNPACCAKTFPDFFELLESVRKKAETPSNNTT